MIMSPDKTQYHGNRAIRLSDFCPIPVENPSKTRGIMIFGDDQ